MKVTGKLLKLLPVETGVSKLGKTWHKQSFIIGNKDFFQSPICFSVIGNTHDLSVLPSEETIQVDFELESTESNGKWYTNINVYTIIIFDSNDAVINTIIINKRPDFKFYL